MQASGISAIAHGLAQKDRLERLRWTRVLMTTVGAIMIIGNVFLLGMAKSEVENQFSEQSSKLYSVGFQIKDEAYWDHQKAQVLKFTQYLYMGQIIVGLVLLLGSFIFYQAPVGVSITALALYAAGWLGPAAIDPSRLVQDIFLNGLILACLAKAVQSAIAFKKGQSIESLAEALVRDAEAAGQVKEVEAART